VTRKHGFAWAAVAVFAALCAVIFWPKSDRSRQKREPERAAVAEEPPVSNDATKAPPSLREREAAVVRALPKASSETVPASDVPTEAEDGVPDHTDVERAQLARLPVIYAIRADYPNDQARFEAMRDALQKSGASTEQWTGSARSILERWGLALEGIERTVDSSSLRCYVAGCEMLVTFPDRATFEQGSAKFRGITDQTPMGRVQTPGVSLPDGQIQVSWMLMRPDTAPPDAG
jgi:hypothetical protein